MLHKINCGPWANEQGLRRKRRWGGLLNGQHWVKWRVKTVPSVKGLWGPRLGMWPLTKKAKPGRSSHRKGFFGSNSEERKARLWGEVQTLPASWTLSSKGPASPFHSYWPPLAHCSQIKQYLICCAQMEEKLGSLSEYWLFKYSSQLFVFRCPPEATREVIKNRYSWNPLNPGMKQGVYNIIYS